MSKPSRSDNEPGRNGNERRKSDRGLGRTVNKPGRSAIEPHHIHLHQRRNLHNARERPSNLLMALMSVRNAASPGSQIAMSVAEDVSIVIVVIRPNTRIQRCIFTIVVLKPSTKSQRSTLPERTLPGGLQRRLVHAAHRHSADHSPRLVKLEHVGRVFL